MPEVVTLGEIMVMFMPTDTGPLRHINFFQKFVAGAEGNFAIGVVRMGLSAGFIGRVGNDEFGKFIINVLRGEGVDVSKVKIDNNAPTGIFFVQRGFPIPNRSIMIYYRKGSAGSKLCLDDLDAEYIGNAKLLHVTGITPALSHSCFEAVKSAIEIAQEYKTKISLDTNIRLKLWSKQKARETLIPLIRKADIIITDTHDSEILVKENNVQKIIKKYRDLGPSVVVIKMGEKGALAATETAIVQKPAYDVPFVDEIGAGDAFSAGFISCLLKGLPIDKALEIANAAGALVVTSKGNIENIPSMEEIQEFLKVNNSSED